MFPFLRTSSVQRLATSLALLVYVVVWFGVLPSPERVGQWIGTNLHEQERYPCESHACGCQSAEECWESCCCMSMVDRLAWAIANGVKPPENASFTDVEWIEAANRVETGSATCSLCVDAIRDRLDAGIPAVSPEDSSDLSRHASVSPASCKGLTQLLLIALPPTRWSTGTQVDFPVPEPRSMTTATRTQLAPSSIWIEVPTPPPRRHWCS